MPIRRAEILRSFVTRLVGGVGLLALASVGVSSAQPVAKYGARLSRGAIDVAALSTVAGAGSVAAELKGNRLVLSGTFKGLLSPATAAHVDRGVAKGVRGKPIADLKVTKATEGTLEGVLDLTASQLADLEEGRLYVVIDSEKAPDGNLWGWILPGDSRK